MKEIILRTNGKKIYQFIVSDTQLKIAEKLGIPEKHYIMELAKVRLAGKDKKNED